MIQSLSSKNFSDNQDNLESGVLYQFGFTSPLFIFFINCSQWFDLVFYGLYNYENKSKR